MKYMGNKRSMLSNGLGHVIELEMEKGQRFFDFFTGSGSVAKHVATRYNVPVIATDLQNYAVALADSVISRISIIPESHLDTWLGQADAELQKNEIYKEASSLQNNVVDRFDEDQVYLAREVCFKSPHGSIANHYGGHYFSALQSITIDALRKTLPEEPNTRKVALAAIVEAASTCAAAPGHTAQPFQPTMTAIPFLKEAWNRDLIKSVSTSFLSLACVFARNKGGEAYCSDAIAAAEHLKAGDVAFIDPPYSAVHYSRFYHVLETICIENEFEVSGKGRYPPEALRPKSAFSLKAKAHLAFVELLKTVAKNGANAIVTFPAGEASNNVSGEIVTEISDQFFHIEQKQISGRFSTLGGNKRNREARQSSNELILRLRPR